MRLFYHCAFRYHLRTIFHSLDRETPDSHFGGSRPARRPSQEQELDPGAFPEQEMGCGFPGRQGVVEGEQSTHPTRPGLFDRSKKRGKKADHGPLHLGSGTARSTLRVYLPFQPFPTPARAQHLERSSGAVERRDLQLGESSGRSGFGLVRETGKGRRVVLQPESAGGVERFGEFGHLLLILRERARFVWLTDSGLFRLWMWCSSSCTCITPALTLSPNLTPSSSRSKRPSSAPDLNNCDTRSRVTRGCTPSTAWTCRRRH